MNTNKTLLAAAIGATLATGALPATADVKVYGKVHVSVDWVDPGNQGATSDAASRKHTSVSSNSSRWGIDVTEKLGNGLTAIAKLESELDATGETSSQNGLSCSRQPSTPTRHGMRRSVSHPV